MSRILSRPARMLFAAVLSITATSRAETPTSSVDNASSATPATTEQAKDHKQIPAELPKKRVLSVAFAQEPNAQSYAPRINYVLESAVRQTKRTEPLPPLESLDSIARLDPAGAQDRSEAAQKGADALSFGLKAYAELQDGLGLEWFDRAIAAYKDSALWEKDNLKAYEKAVLMRIVVKWSDDPGVTRREIANLLTVDPKAELPSGLSPTPPQDLAQEFERQRDNAGQAQRTTLDVAARPAGARVYLDGVYKGVTPLGIPKVALGEHIISIVTPGYESAQRILRVSPGDTVSESLKETEKGRQLRNAIETARQSWGKPEERDAEKKLCQLVDADEVQLASIVRNSGQLEMHLHRYRLSDGHHTGCADMAPVSEVDPQLLHNAGETVLRSLSSDRALCGGQACACQASIPVNLPAVVGTGVSAAVLLATGVTLAVIAKLKSDEFTRLPQTNPDLKNRGNEVLMYAIPSDICNGLGLISAGVWAYLAFGTTYAQRSSIEPQEFNAPAPASGPKPETDPFEAQLETPSVPPGLTFAVVPQTGGVSFSLQGGF